MFLGTPISINLRLLLKFNFSILARSIIGSSEAVLVKTREEIDIFSSNSFNPLQTISKSGKSVARFYALSIFLLTRISL